MKLEELDNLSDKLGNKAKDLIFEICDIAYTRLPGSENEAKAQKYLYDKFKEIGADEVLIQKYKVYPKFFLYWPKLSFVLFVIGLAFYLWIPLISFIFIVLNILNIVLKSFSFTGFDIFFPKKESMNVIAKLYPKTRTDNKSKRILIIGGHTDSTYEFPIASKLGTKGFKILIPLAIWLIFLMLSILIISILEILDGKFVRSLSDISLIFSKPDWIFIIALIGLPYLAFLAFNFIHNEPVPGANDNLSGVAVIFETFKYFAENRDHLQNLELWAVCFGSEEAGMIGSKTLAKEIKRKLENGTLNAEEVWVVNFDSVGADGPLHIATKEPLYRCVYLPDVYMELEKIAKKYNIDCIVKSLAAGTDSSPFGRKGIPATGILCFGDGSAPPNWHSLQDTPKNINENGLKKSIKLLIPFIYEIDNSLRPS
ncbi:MAG: M28 family metallopeptidase [Promethearchaeota archaeon]